MSAYIKTFLKNLGIKRPNFCYSVGPKQMRNTKILDTALEVNGKNDIYFYVNEGGTRGFEINKINACFVDLDVGRDATGKYFKPSEVKKKKVFLRNKLTDCAHQPNIIVETRNGYQAYWILRNCNNNCLSRWMKVQAKLINLFKADPWVGKVNQIMRLPGTYWVKAHEGKKDKFLTSYQIIRPLRNTYTLLEMEKNLRGISDKITKEYRKTSDSEKWVKPKIVADGTPIDPKKPWLPAKTNNNDLANFLRDVSSLLTNLGYFYMTGQAKKFYEII